MRGLVEDRAMRDLATSFWLKDAIRSTQDRDPVDVLHDVHLLLGVARERVETACLLTTEYLKNRSVEI